MDDLEYKIILGVFILMIAFAPKVLLVAMAGVAWLLAM